MRKLRRKSTGSQVESSGDINPKNVGQVTFNLTTTSGTFQYHCLYHPQYNERNNKDFALILFLLFL